MNLIDLSQEHFYPRPPRGGRHTCFLPPAEVVEISIHALREEGDRKSTRRREHTHISIHALREEGDTTAANKPQQVENFYPRPPRGGRQCSQSSLFGTKKFLSTPSARRATEEIYKYKGQKAISIHALREEGDHLALSFRVSICVFLSTPSARRATFLLTYCATYA